MAGLVKRIVLSRPAVEAGIVAVALAGCGGQPEPLEATYYYLPG